MANFQRPISLPRASSGGAEWLAIAGAKALAGALMGAPATLDKCMMRVSLNRRRNHILLKNHYPGSSNNGKCGYRQTT